MNQIQPAAAQPTSFPLAKAGAKPNSPTFFGSLQAGRGLAALIVVLYHCEGLFGLPKYWHAPKFFFYFGASGVEFFFVLSGIVILNAHWSDINKPGKLRHYAWKRFRRIYPLYWIVLLLVLPLYFAVPSFGNGVETQRAVILDSFLLLPLTRVVSILPIAWTLYHEIMFYVVFSFLLVRKGVGFCILGVWLGCSVLQLFLPAHNPVTAACFSPLHLLFGFGLVVVALVRRMAVPGMPLFVVGLIGFAACCIVDDLRQPTTPFLSLIYGVSAALAAAGLMFLEKRRPLPIPGFLILLGDASYSLYLVHYMVLSAAAKLVYPVWRRHQVPLPIPFVVLIALAIAAGIVVHLFVEQPLLRRLAKV